jgi:protein O-mannosyl-transferase
MSKMLDNITAHRWAPFAIIATLTLIAYCNIFGNQFLFDDDLLIIHNKFIKSWSYLYEIFTQSVTAGSADIGGFYRPLQNITYLIVYSLAGLDPIAFHFPSFFLHIANGCLLFSFGKKLGFNRLPLLIACVIWAIHPIHTQAITYMSGIADPLYAFFVLIALNYLLPDFTLRKILHACPIFMLALLSKETAVTFLPILFVVMFYCKPDVRWQPKTYAVTWPLWVTAGIFLIWRFGFIDLAPVYIDADPYNHNIMLRVWTFFATIPSYIGLLLAPIDLRLQRTFLVYDHPFYKASMAGIAVIGYVLWLALRKRTAPASPAAFAGLWFFAAMAVYTGILHPLNALILEHWMYVPIMGLFIGMAEALSRKQWNIHRPVLVAASATLIVAMMTMTFIQNRVWYDIFTLYAHIQKFDQLTARDYNNIATQYDNTYDYDGAIQYYYKALSVDDFVPVTRYNLGFAIMKRARTANRDLTEAEWEECMKHFRRAVELEPRAPAPYYGIMKLYEMKKNFEKAAEFDLKLKEAERNAGLAKP